jgi:hypothetical protein
MPAIPNTYPLYLSSKNVNFGADEGTRINFGGSHTTVDLSGAIVDLSGANIIFTNTSIDTSLNALQGSVGTLEESVGTLVIGLNELGETVNALDTGNMTGLINSLNSLSETKDLSLNNFYRTPGAPGVVEIVGYESYTLEFIIDPFLSNRYKGWDISGANIDANTKIQDVSKNGSRLIVITNNFNPPDPPPVTEVVDTENSLTINNLVVSISIDPKQFSIADFVQNKPFNLTSKQEDDVDEEPNQDAKNIIIRNAGIAAAIKEVEKDIFVSSAGSYTLTLNIADKINMIQGYIINLYESILHSHPADIAFPLTMP